MASIIFVTLLLFSLCGSIYSFPITSKISISRDMDSSLIDYNKLLEAQKDDKIVIIDVREDSEVQETGKLPGSIHIPMKQVLNELNLPYDEFQEKYGRTKPTLNTQIITSCRSGRRSEMVQLDLLKAGYKNVYNYKGGWLDWEKHHG